MPQDVLLIISYILISIYLVLELYLNSLTKEILSYFFITQKTISSSTVDGYVVYLCLSEWEREEKKGIRKRIREIFIANNILGAREIKIVIMCLQRTYILVQEIENWNINEYGKCKYCYIPRRTWHIVRWMQMSEGIFIGRVVGEGLSEEGACRPDLSGRWLKR